MASINHNEPQPFLPILHAASDSYYWKGNGSLSIKTFINGRALYQTGHGHYAVDEDSYLLLNAGQEYSITIESNKEVESFCIFFPVGMAEEVHRSLLAKADSLLEDPLAPVPSSIDFVEKTYRHDTLLTPALRRMRERYPTMMAEGIWVEETLRNLMERLLHVRLNVLSDMEKLPALRASTKEELYKRIHIGQDYLLAYYDQPISLEALAQAACMSPNHFLRSYKHVFGVTPHQFLIERRLQAAKKLLGTTGKSVTEICLEVGFQSVGSFSSLFHKRFGISPSRCRQKSDFQEAAICWSR